MINLQTTLGKTFRLIAFFGVSSAAFWQPLRPLVFVGESMSPTYRSGEYAVTVPVNGDLQRGDVVVVETEEGPIVKRVAHLPGDRLLQLRNAKGWIDISQTISLGILQDSSRFEEREIPAGYVYVLGDNRAVSLDSRVFGPVSLDRISRKVLNPRPIESNN